MRASSGGDEGIRQLNATLEERVRQRTAELAATNERLQLEVTERQRREATLRAVWQISEAVHAAGDSDQLFARIHAIIGGLMPARNFYLALHDRAANLVTFPYYSDTQSPPPPPRRFSAGLTEYVLGSRRPLLATRDSVEKLIQRGEHFPQGPPASVWLGVPLLVHGEPIGVMAVQDYENPHAFGEDEQQLLMFIAEQTAVAIDRKRAEQARQRREQVQHATWKISEAVHATQDLDHLYARIHQIVSELMPAKNFYLLLHDWNTGLDHTVYWQDEADPPPPPRRFRHGMTAWVLRNGLPLRATRAEMARPAPPGLVEATGDEWYLEAGTPSAVWLGVPLKIGGEVIGVMAVQDYHDERAYGDEAQQILTFVAEQIALAIQRKRAETELVRSLERERELGQLKSNFVSTVSHEFRTPLGVIVSSAGLLEKYFERLEPEERRAHLASIRANTRRMSDLMEEVLLFGKVEEGKLVCDLRPLHLPSFARRLVDELLAATDRRCQVHVRLGNAPVRVFADERLLHPVLTNLLTNAVKYSPAGNPVDLDIESAGGHLVFRVSDRGCGIPEADLPKLFQAFHRGANVAHVPGTGLGLVIVRRCVTLHGGEIEVKSKVGEGSTVTARIPLQLPPSTPADRP